MSLKRAVISIDHGTKRTGLAATDALRIVTRALEVWQGPGDSPELVERIAVLVSERDAGTLVVGLPSNMDGTEGPRAAEVRAFGRRLAARLPDTPLVFQDERLSTKVAEELMREAGVRRRDARGQRDSFSALVILRDWIEAGEPGPEPSAGG